MSAFEPNVNNILPPKLLRDNVNRLDFQSGIKAAHFEGAKVVKNGQKMGSFQGWRAEPARILRLLRALDA